VGKFSRAPKHWALKRVAFALEDANGNLEHAVYMLEGMAAAKFETPSDPLEERLAEERKSAEVMNQIQRAEQFLELIRQRSAAAIRAGATSAAANAPR